MLQKIRFKPGFNKQATPTGAEGQWVDGDNVRFRYGEPEKIGGWQQLVSTTLSGAARAQHSWTDLDLRKYAAIGTNKLLVVYYEGTFYDITPLEDAQSGGTFDSTTSSQTVTVNLTAHNLNVGDYFVFSAVTLPGGGETDFATSAFTTNAFEVITTPDANTFTITMASAEGGTGMSNQGTCSIQRYVTVGPANQSAGYGFGTGLWGGTLTSAVSSTLNGGINDLVTTITLADSSSFPSTGTVLIDSELITYTGNTANQLTGCTRGALGTSPDSHSNGATVKNATDFVAWGEESSSTAVIIEPGSWSLDNFGQTLVATIKDNRTFTWQPIAAAGGALTTRATVMTGAPTKSMMTLTSDRDRHLFHFGTETTIGSTSTQDNMFIRFSNQEDYSTYTPTATNTAGTFRLDTGNQIIGAVQAKDYILVLTDQAAYVIQFVGPPFTFSIRQVGTNCGALGQHAMVYAQGAVFWMGFGGGFFKYDGTVKQLSCLVEDFVFTTNDGAPGINYDASQTVFAYHNSLYNEVGWFYSASASSQVNRNVVYNFVEDTWTTGTLARTTYEDAHTYGLPYATKYTPTGTPTFPTINGVTNTPGSSTYYAHETGTDETDVNANFVTTITSYVTSGDYDLDARQGLAGDGEDIMRVSRFVPDFKNLSGNAKVTLRFRNYPTQSPATDADYPLVTGPFTCNTTTTFVSTRVRGRQVSLKIENDAQGETWRYGTLRLDVHAGGKR